TLQNLIIIHSYNKIPQTHLQPPSIHHHIPPILHQSNQTQLPQQHLLQQPLPQKTPPYYQTFVKPVNQANIQPH
ncbi:hypothetical protein, partial [Bacillus sp. WP8]|uniref:hypothetical protein n=1 Tax=Bacillus sp. WP8 TaxID=756828 RepID=UPI001C92FC51